MEQTVGLGAGALPTTDLVLDVGPQHPSTHGTIRLRVTLDGDRVLTADPLVGQLHRGAEKLFEVRDYRQVMVLANRHDWLSAFGSELGVALVVEQMLGMDVPERATWLRTALAELQRVVHALTFAAGIPGVDAGFVRAEREALQAVLEEASGGRMHLMFNRVGGLKEDVPLGWVGRVRAAADQARAALPRLLAAVRSGELEAARGLGVLTAAACEELGVSGPVARASGLDLDLRRDAPYLAYAELGFGSSRFPVVLGTEGDVVARWTCLVEQVPVSLALVDACLDRLPAGPVALRTPKAVRPGEGSAYVWTENPSGANGWWLVSRGEKTPWRLKLRTSGFATAQALGDVVPGTRVADLATVLGSMVIVVGDVDR